MEPQAIALANWVPIGDQVLLMASVFLTYVAGVFPSKKNTNVTSQNNIFTHKQEPEPLTSPSYGSKNNVDEGNPKNAWGIVRGKLLECLDAIELESNLGNKVLELEQKQTKRPLSLYAVAEGPKLRLLWASFQQLEKEMNRITNDSMDVDNWLTVFCEIIRKSCQPICLAWLEKEVSLVNNNPNLSLISLVTEKLKGDDTILANIRKSGKENLYAEFLHFLCFGSLSREGCCYEHNLFILHGDSILEDLVISLADGIASIYLELVSVDGNLSNEMNSLGFGICSLSTRALQRLRNEVALNQWLYQNLEAVASMFEDRFDLSILQRQLIEEPTMNGNANQSWWKMLNNLGKSGAMSSPLSYVLISSFAMPVKRTKELRALTGWRYYFSLFLELSDISMPFIRAVFEKVSNAVSFFLVSLIGRSLGLIYTGIRQSLQWK
ncbi:hypothetical protein ACFE04_001331 [Oxalis oulophora]